MRELTVNEIVVFEEKHGKRYFSGALGWPAIAAKIFAERIKFSWYPAADPGEPPAPPTPPPEGSDARYVEIYQADLRKHKEALRYWRDEKKEWELFEAATRSAEAAGVYLESRRGAEYEGFTIEKLEQI